MNINIGEILTNRSRLLGHKEGFVRGSNRISFKEMNERANAFAHYLQTIGLKTGDKLAILCKNNEHFVTAFFGAAKIGVISVSVNWRLQKNELLYILNHCDAKAVLFEADFKQ